jgi:hypothetical protein
MTWIKTCAGKRHRQRGDYHIDRWPGDGDQKLFGRLLRDALEPRHAADR